MEAITITQTQSQVRRQKVIDLIRGLLDDQENDITTGIDDGIYKKEENVETLQAIEDHRKLVDEFEKDVPEVLVFVEGGNIQGASATESIVFNLFDIDNYKACSGKELKQFVKFHGTPDAWDAMINRRTAAGELMPIF